MSPRKAAEPLWVDNPKHSKSSIPLDRLDFTNWYPDGPCFDGSIYLHVPAKPDPTWGETEHRVWPRGRAKGACQVMVIDGRLAWRTDDNPYGFLGLTIEDLRAEVRALRRKRSALRAALRAAAKLSPRVRAVVRKHLEKRQGKAKRRRKA